MNDDFREADAFSELGYSRVVGWSVYFAYPYFSVLESLSIYNIINNYI